MDNIEFLLQSLNSEIRENETILENVRHCKISSTTLETETRNVVPNLSNSIIEKHDSLSNVESLSTKDYDFEITKKQLSSKYSGSGNEIHEKLKENVEKSYAYERRPQTWSSKVPSERREEPSRPNLGLKQDVYAEPVFGLRLINPIVSSSLIEAKMVGRLPVSVSNVPNHLRCGEKCKDWVFAGAVVFKSGLKTSQKGSQYCLWKISDLKKDLKQITLYLFGKACSELWKVSLGTVVAVLNAFPFYKDEKVNNDEVTLTIKNPDQVMILGGSRDYGVCKALKKNGEKCTSFVNKNTCEFCIFHVKKEYNKYAGTRSSLQAPSIGLVNLRNKVLSKNEYFYAGKTYTAVNVAKKSHSKQQNFTNCIPSVMKKLQESDHRKLEKLGSTKTQHVDVAVTEDGQRKNVCVDKPDFIGNDDANLVHMLSVSNENMLQSNTQNSSRLSSMKFRSEKPVLSRLHLFKQAGARMVESGQMTRVSAATKTKKAPCFSFADILTEEPSLQQSAEISDLTDNKMNKNKVTLNRKDTTIDLSMDVRKLPKYNSSLASNKFKIFANEKITSTVNTKNNSKTPSDSVNASKVLQDFKNLARNTIEGEPKNKPVGAEEDVRIPEFIKVAHEEQDLSNQSQIHNGKIAVSSFLQHLSSPSNSVHDTKKARARQNAISLIKKQGGIVKSNPNQVRPGPNQRRSIKRCADNSDTDETGECLEKSVLSKRFVDLMKATSRHENLVEIAEYVERQDYFNKMEKKEQLEEKMLTTYKIPCKAVLCLKCKYKWFSASDLCRAEGHPIKVIDAVKRYFKCDNCTNRTISLEVVPLISCKNCGSSKWSRAGMIKEKFAKNENALSIRGDEIKYLDTLSHSMNINLLVPEDT